MRTHQITPFTATAAVAGRRIVKHGAADDTVVQATAATELFAGVSDPMGAAAGKVCDVHQDGIAEVEYGGNVTRGQPLTADANGRAILANPAAGATVEIIGHAQVSGVSGDFGRVLIGRSTFTRPAA